MVQPIAGCWPDFGTHPEPDRIAWSDGEARLVVKSSVEDGFPDAILDYAIELEHFGRAPVVVDARSVQIQHFALEATRLPDARIAWIVNHELVCEERGGAITCTDLVDPCCDVQVAGVRCTCEREPTSREALRWAFGRDQMLMSRAANRGR